MSKWLPTIIAMATASLTAVTPQIQGTISHHPVAATVLTMLYAIFGHVLPSPVGK